MCELLAVSMSQPARLTFSLHTLASRGRGDGGTHDGWGGAFRIPASPARFPEGAPKVRRAAPKLGEHTREVLEAAGLTPEEIAAVL